MLTLLNNFCKFPKRRNREFFQPNREFKLQNRELSGGSGNRRTGPPQLQIGGPETPLFADFRSRTAEDPITCGNVRYLPNFVRFTYESRCSWSRHRLPSVTQSGLNRRSGQLLSVAGQGYACHAGMFRKPVRLFSNSGIGVQAVRRCRRHNRFSR